MPQQTSKSGKAAEHATAWRERLLRHASSGQSIEAFCLSESVSVASFYNWRSKLRARQASVPALPGTAPDSPFIDLGAIDASASLKRPAADQAATAPRRAEIDVRIELGCGVLLTITRH